MKRVTAFSIFGAYSCVTEFVAFVNTVLVQCLAGKSSLSYLFLVLIATQSPWTRWKTQTFLSLFSLSFFFFLIFFHSAFSSLFSFFSFHHFYQKSSPHVGSLLPVDVPTLAFYFAHCFIFFILSCWCIILLCDD